MEDPRERLLRYIDDARAAEEGIADVLKGFIDEVNNEAARTAFQQHLTLTKSQADRLEQRLRALGGEPSGGKGFFNMLMGKLSDLMHGAHDDWDKTTQNLIKANATEHLEIGMYASLAAYSRAYGDQETAVLAEQIMAEEQQTADLLRPMIPTAAADTYVAAMEQKAA